MVDFKLELRSEVATIGQKVELLGVRFESGMREMRIENPVTYSNITFILLR